MTAKSALRSATVFLCAQSFLLASCWGSFEGRSLTLEEHAELRNRVFRNTREGDKLCVDFLKADAGGNLLPALESSQQASTHEVSISAVVAKAFVGHHNDYKALKQVLGRGSASEWGGVYLDLYRQIYLELAATGGISKKILSTERGQLGLRMLLRSLRDWDRRNFIPHGFR